MDGRVFIETSPDVEYLFRIQIGRLGNTYYTCNIDGVNIGYDNICQEADIGMSTIQGSWKVANGVEYDTSMQFVLEKNRRAAEARTYEPPKIGRLTAVFSEGIKGEGKTVQGDADSTIQFKKDQAAVAPASTGQNAKKSFKN